MYRELTFADFRNRRGDTFDVRAPGGVVPLVLAQVQELPGSGRQGGSFRLEFQGPPAPPLGQGMFPFMVGGSWVNIFIVPVGIVPQGMRYEAIFY